MPPVALIFVFQDGRGYIWPSDIFRNKSNGVQPEPVNTLIQPVSQYIIQLLPDLRVLPVEVGLMPGKIMQIPASGGFIVMPSLPRRVKKSTTMRRFPLFSRPPVIIVIKRIVPAAARLPEPAMLIAGVIDHHIHNDLHAF